MYHKQYILIYSTELAKVIDISNMPAGVLVIRQWEWKFSSPAEHEDGSSSDHSDLEKVDRVRPWLSS